MTFIEDLKDKAKAQGKTIVLCEGEDKRVVDAAKAITREGVAKIILLSDTPVDGVNTINIASYERLDELAQSLFDARAGKVNKKTGAPEYETPAAAREYILKDHTMAGALLLKLGVADGFVSGACHTTANTLRPGLQVIKTAPGIKTVSSSFIMVADRPNPYIPEGVCLFSDCAINIEPTAEELADIALATADTAKKIAGITPKVAFLSFSTKGSGNDKKFTDSVTKVQEAVRLGKEKAPDLLCDGEFQFDAAVSKDVASLKAPGSTVAGSANVFIFPNINAGNIGYKIAQRLGGWSAIGPICQGFARPLNDLSRGCSVEDIIDTVAVTALQA